jgi:hypothetical protein
MFAPWKSLAAVAVALTTLSACGDDAPEPKARTVAKQPTKAPTPKAAKTTPAVQSSTVSTGERVEWIRKQYNRTQKNIDAKQWPKVTIDAARYDFQAAEGVKIELYCEGGTQPRKLLLGLYGEMGRIEAQVFIKKMVPFFGLRTDIAYSSPGGTEASRTEHRFYYDGPKVVRVVGHDKKNNDSPTGKTAKLASELQADAEQILRTPNICKG